MKFSLESFAEFWQAGGPLMPVLAAVSVAIWYQTFCLYFLLLDACRRGYGPEGRVPEEKILREPRRRLMILKALVAAAPLLGLLGTVKGMIATFIILGSRGVASMDILAEGISEALITTQAGLAMALPGLIGAHASGSLLIRLERLRRRSLPDAGEI